MSNSSRLSHAIQATFRSRIPPLFGSLFTTQPGTSRHPDQIRRNWSWFVGFALACYLLAAVPAVHAIDFDWDAAASGNWNDGTKWTPAGVPDVAGETATIDATGTPYTVTLNINPTIDAFDLNSADATLSAIGRTLTVDGAANLTAGLTDWRGSTWAGTGTLTNDATLRIGGSSQINNSVFDQNGIVDIQGGLSSTGTLTTANGVNNSGTINLESILSTFASNLTVTSGTLNNSGFINVNTGTGGNRTISANLTNNNTVNLNTDTIFSKSSGVYTNNAGFNIAAGKQLTITAFTQTFNQDSGTLDIDGIFKMTSADFEFNGGVITGTPTLNAVDLTIGAGSTGAATFAMGASSTLSGDIAAAQTVGVHGGQSSTATLTAANSFINAGVINLESTVSTNQSNLTVSSGTLNNSGFINVNTGTGGTRTISANLTNNGTVNLNTDTIFSKSGGLYTNNADFNIAAGKTLTINAFTQTFKQDGGTLDIDGTFLMTSADFEFNGGVITGTPTLNAVDLTIGAGSTGAATFAMGNSSTLSGDIAAAQTVGVHGGQSSTATLTAANSFLNAGTINLESILSTFNSNLTVTSGTLNNSGFINVNTGTGGLRTISANLTNNNTVNLNTDTTFSKSGGVYTNNNDFNIAAGEQLTITAFTQTFNQDGGTLDIDGIFKMTSADFNFNGGVINGAPTLNAVDLTIGAGSTGAATFAMGNSSTLSGDIAAAQTVGVHGGQNSTATLTAANNLWCEFRD